MNLDGQDIGPYTVGARVGEGGFAVVYRAVHRELGREVALKLLKPHFGREDRVLQRFQRESKFLAKLAHPGIITVYDQGKHADTPWFAMPFLAEPTLQQLLERQRGEPLGVPRACAIIASMLEALSAAHDASIVHRDLKPSNAFVRADCSVVLTDFGIAKPLDGSTQITGAGESIGTLIYAAPEQLSSEEIGPSADLYAVGLMLYELVAGRLPFGSTPAEIVKAKAAPLPPVDAPAPLADVVARAVQADPAARFASAAEFRSALLAAVPRTGAATRPAESGAARRGSGSTRRPGATGSTPVPRGESRSRTGLRWIVLGGALTLGAVGFAAGFLAGRRAAPVPAGSPASVTPSAQPPAASDAGPIDTESVPKYHRAFVETFARQFPGYAPSPEERKILALLVERKPQHERVEELISGGLRRIGPQQLIELEVEDFFPGHALPPLLRMAGGTEASIQVGEQRGPLPEFTGLSKIILSKPADLADWIITGVKGDLDTLRRARHHEPFATTFSNSGRSIVFYLSIMRAPFYEEVGGWARLLLLPHPLAAPEPRRLAELDRRISAYFRARPDPR